MNALKQILKIYNWVKLVFFSAGRVKRQIIVMNKPFDFIQEQFVNFFENDNFDIRGYNFSCSMNSFLIKDDETYKPFPIKKLSQYFISYEVSETENSKSALLKITLKFTPFAQYTFLGLKVFSFIAFCIAIIFLPINNYFKFLSNDAMTLITIVSFIFLLISASISIGDYYRIERAKSRLLRAIGTFESGKTLNYF